MQILNSLFPIFAVIALGMILRRSGFLNHEITQGFNRFAYYFALPMFLFYKLGSAQMDLMVFFSDEFEWKATVGAGMVVSYMLTLLAATLLTAFLAWLFCKPLGVGFGSQGAFIQACFRGNLAFIGLPLIMFAIFDFPVERKTEIEAAMLVAITPILILYNVLSVAVLAVFNKETDSEFSWTYVLKNIATNPLLWASVLGVVFQAAGWTIPTSVERTCAVVGASAFPMALLGIGSQLISISISGNWILPLVSSVVKSVLCPLIGWAVATSLGLSGVELKVILIMCASPTAVSSYVLADQMNGDGDLAAGSVVIGTACSLLTLSVLLWLTG